MFDTRLSRLANSMLEKGVAAVAVNAGPTLSYLSGLHFHLMERPVVMVFCSGHEPILILPELEQAKLSDLSFPARIYAYGENPEGWQARFCEALAGLGLAGRKVAVEPRQLRFLEYDYLRLACRDTDFIDGSDILSALRLIKDQQEMACLRRAVKIAEDALTATLPLVKIGVTEKEIAGELFLQLVRHGSDIALPFAPIVAAGPNGANPHAQPSERRLAAGDLLVVDWGACCNGYVSDLTRTFAVGKVDGEAKKIHEIVEQANSAGRAAGGAGVPCARVDQATRAVIEKAGYGPQFTHRTGHGIGLECHEEPFIRGDNKQLLEIGMAYTVEPGIYLAGKNGARIEDDMVITADGCESLSTMSRAMRIIG